VEPAIHLAMRTGQFPLDYQPQFEVLTGIWNRGAILDLLNREIERSRRAHSTIGLLMLDVDHFKKINDTYGHP
jgi:diguanylate cyclase (GGDEF)-like protein